MVRDESSSGPVAFTRDHLDAGAMAHPNIMTERMRDGSDAIAGLAAARRHAMCSSQADLVAIHSGGGGYAGYMTSAGVTLIADGTPDAASRWVAEQRHGPRRDALCRAGTRTRSMKREPKTSAISGCLEFTLVLSQSSSEKRATSRSSAINPSA